MQDRARKPNKEFNRISKVSQGTVQGPLRQNFARQCKNMPESSRRNSLGAASMQDHARNAQAGLHQDLLLRRREQEFLLMLAYKEPFRIPPLRQESRRCRDRKPTNALTRMIWKKIIQQRIMVAPCCKCLLGDQAWTRMSCNLDSFLIMFAYKEPLEIPPLRQEGRQRHRQHVQVRVVATCA